MAIGFASSELIALVLESIFYGMYFALFAECVKVLCHKRRRTAGGNHRLILVSVSLFILITWHQIVDAIRLYYAYQKSGSAEGADQYYSRVTAVLSIMKTSIYLAETAVSDMFILYRCYIVWNASLAVLAFPVLLYVADIAMGIAAVYTLSLVGTNVVFNNHQQRISNSFFSCTLALNAVCTGLIAYRIWRTQQQTREAKMGSSNLTKVAIIVVESGAIYLTVLASEVAAFAVGSYMFNIFLDITSPIIGIVFSLIIVRIGRGVSSEETRPPQSISYSMPSKTSARNSRSTGPIVFKSTTTTQMTDSGTTFKGGDLDDGTYKMTLPSDGDSSIDA